MSAVYFKRKPNGDKIVYSQRIVHWKSYNKLRLLHQKRKICPKFQIPTGREPSSGSTIVREDNCQDGQMPGGHFQGRTFVQDNCIPPQKSNRSNPKSGHSILLQHPRAAPKVHSDQTNLIIFVTQGHIQTHKKSNLKGKFYQYLSYLHLYRAYIIFLLIPKT